MAEWIGFDLDGTLAEYTSWDGSGAIGKPIPKMVARVQKHLARGDKVKIFTARAYKASQVEIQKIQDWAFDLFGQVLEVTCSKDYTMRFLYDDRCIQVETNMGIITGTDPFKEEFK